ncbi:hypothetical protein CEUSTIGMA_g6596.t1 [Chlamydomonas eustigma]|uniref:EamA domain-containing protein n=1 Tax=Chlamydomonas eustigma TaxID=1157962 RepID=A0A250X7X2_9CHLO|nr:hypothetical protein CEUSTIGMA_g6596.t1 [Chlamydomonas eustigma]|eukprot:GAX79156.1 hypothetical protein CEUSTIGMA_g6596.t1 [Chlamydomonas eustigma]
MRRRHQEYASPEIRDADLVTDQAVHDNLIGGKLDSNELRITVMPNQPVSFTRSNIWHQLSHLAKSGASIYTIALLCTGCSLALMSQHMANQGMAMNQAQLPAWTRYTMNFLLSWLVEVIQITASTSQLLRVNQRKADGAYGTQGPHCQNVSLRQGILLIGMGSLDVLGYVLNSMGFAKCGAALSIVLGAAAGQICNAVTHRLILKKTLSRQQLAALAVVTSGLMVRGLGSEEWWTYQNTALYLRWDLRTASGMVLIILGALSYSLLGVGYDWLVHIPSVSPLSQVQINRWMSFVGAAVITGYQIIYTWPRREILVYERIRLSELTISSVVCMYLTFGGVYTLHSFIQGKVLRKHGAVSFGIINAMRSVVVSVASAALFCRSSSTITSQCLTVASGSSSLIVTLGVIMWTVTPPTPPVWPTVKDSNGRPEINNAVKKEE